VVDQLRHWLAWLETQRSPIAIGLALAVPVVSFVAGLVVTLALPPDYFVRARPSGARPKAPVRLALQVLRNLIGGLVLLAGLVMAVPLVPGPGVLFMLIGVGLVDFPGKRALELKLLRQRHVLLSVNRIRGRFGRAPLQTSESDAESVVDKGP
jgi:hypothetical protein